MSRGLNDDFIDKLKGDYTTLLDYVKNNDNIFLGIRKNSINLYVNGGSLLRLDQSNEGYKGYVDENYLKNDLKYDDEKVQKTIEPTLKKIKAINNKEVEDIDKWIKLLDDLKNIVIEYQEGNYEKGKVHREKILQQNIVQSINATNNKYFAYDMEYAIEGANDYRYNRNGDAIKERRPVTLGRADILVCSIDKDKKCTIYFVEVKEKTGAYGGVSKVEGKETFGSGIVGHIKNYVPVINMINNDLQFSSEYNKKIDINLRDRMMSELKDIIQNYNELGLLENKPLFTATKSDDFRFNKAELVFFLGDYNNTKIPSSFENHLGIKDGDATCTVRKLLDNKEKSINLDFIASKEIIDFKYKKSKFGYKSTIKDLQVEIDFEKYNEVKKEDFI